jgi:hypothetical protein
MVNHQHVYNAMIFGEGLPLVFAQLSDWHPEIDPRFWPPDNKLYQKDFFYRFTDTKNPHRTPIPAFIINYFKNRYEKHQLKKGIVNPVCQLCFIDEFNICIYTRQEG